MISREDKINYSINNDKIKDILAKIREVAKSERTPIVHPQAARLITVIGNIVIPRRILEVGTAVGYSTILMSTFLKNGGQIDTIERRDIMVQISRNNIRNAGLENTINVIAGDALDVLPCLDKIYDMIFLDAAKGQYIRFLPDCLRMLANGGVLISDNVLYRGMIKDDASVPKRQRTIARRLGDYIDTLLSNTELITSVIPVGDGVTISYKKTTI